MQSVFRITSFVLLIYLAVLYGIGVKYLQVSCDAGYYLSIARDIAHGKVLFVDIYNTYAPFLFYYFSVFFKLFPSISYEGLLCAQILIEVTGGLAFYFIARKLVNEKWVAVTGALLFLIAMFHNEGYHIMLEPLVVTFTLWALVVMFYYNSTTSRILTGVLIGCAFLSKQYGMLGLGAGLVYILLQEKSIADKLRNSAALIIGFTTIIGVYFFYKIVGQGMGSAAFLSQFFPANPSRYQVSSENKFMDFVLYLLKPHVLIYFMPALFVLVFRFRELFRNKILITLYAALILFTGPLFLIQFVHYKMLFIPFAMLLFTYVLHEAYQGIWPVKAMAAVWMLLLLAMPARAFYSFIGTKEKDRQYETAKALKQIIGHGTHVALYSGEEQYFLAALQSCDLKKYSYGFITYMADDKIYEKADYVVFDTLHIPDTARLRTVYRMQPDTVLGTGVIVMKREIP